MAPPELWLTCGATDAKIDPLIESQFAAGRLYAAISSRPGQSGRADGYILEGRELEVSAADAEAEVGGQIAHGITWDAVLPEEDQDWQAEARTRCISDISRAFYFSF